MYQQKAITYLKEYLNLYHCRVIGELLTTKFLLRLYIAGISIKSNKAINNLKKVCEENLKGSYKLEIIDIQKNPKYAKKENIIASPTLIKKLPLPVRILVGDMSNKEQVLVGLEIVSKNRELEK